MNNLILVRPIVDIVDYSKDNKNSFRKIWADYHPEGDSSVKKLGNFRLTSPRISKCKTMLEEDVALCDNPTEKLGTSQTRLTPTEKVWVNNSRNKNDEVIANIVTNKNRPPLIFVFP